AGFALVGAGLRSFPPIPASASHDLPHPPLPLLAYLESAFFNLLFHCAFHFQNLDRRIRPVVFPAHDPVASVRADACAPGSSGFGIQTQSARAGTFLVQSPALLRSREIPAARAEWKIPTRRVSRQTAPPLRPRSWDQTPSALSPS